MPVSPITLLPADDTGTPGDNTTSTQLNVRFTATSTDAIFGWHVAIDLGPNGIDDNFNGETDEAGEDIQLLDTVSYIQDQFAQTFTIGVNLAAGTYDLLFFSEAVAGADGVSASDTFTILADSTPPDLAAGDDSGASNSDNITSQTTGLTFSGTSTAAGQTIELIDYTDNNAQLSDSIDNDSDGFVDEADEGNPTVTVLGTTVSGPAGAWQLDVNLSEGNHGITTRVNGGSLNGLTVVDVDTTPAALTSASVLSDGSIRLVGDSFLAGAYEVGDFTVTVNGVARAVSAITTETTATASNLILTLAQPVERFETVNLTYSAAAGTPGSIVDLAGNATTDFSFSSIPNLSEVDTTPPTILSAKLGTTSEVWLEYSEPLGILAADAIDPSQMIGDFEVLVNGTPATISQVILSNSLPAGLDNYLVLLLASPIPPGATVSISYDKDAGNPGSVQDMQPGGNPPNEAADQLVNLIPNTPPAFDSATLEFTSVGGIVPLTEGNLSAGFIGQFFSTGTEPDHHQTLGIVDSFVSATVTDSQGVVTAVANPGADIINQTVTRNGDAFTVSYLLGIDPAQIQFLDDGDTLRLTFTLSTAATGETAANQTVTFVITGQNEVVNGTALADTLTGSINGDTITGLDGSDIINGMGGRDNIDAGLGDDNVNGGDGNDTINGGSGDDTLAGSAGNDVINGGNGDDVLTGGSGNDTISGGIETDVLIGGSGNDTLIGNEGADDLQGGSGNDTLQGGIGFDTMRGGEGDDTYIVDLDDSIFEFSNSGTDTVRAQFSYVLDANLENLVLLNTGNFSGTGNSFNNVITGNSGANALSGLDGADTLISGSGADTLTGGNGADTFRFEAISMSRAANGIDTIMDFSFAAGDRIDVSLIDANTSLANDQAFTSLIAEGATFNAAGQIRLTTIAGGYQIDLNTNTNSAAEMSIIVMTTDAAAGALGWLVP